MVNDLTGGEAVVKALEALDVRRVYGIVSVHNLPIVDALARSDRITMVEVRHEQAAVHAADGESRATGRLGVALASTGPGTANAMGGLFEAGFASSRVLLLTGQTETTWYGKGRATIHEAEEQLTMLRTVCRRAEHVRFHADIARTVLDVARDILAGRPRPGAVEIPIDLQYAKGGPVDVSVPAPPPSKQPDPAAVERAVAALAGARRPLVWAGGGVVSAGVASELTAFAERLGAPVLTSTEGRGSIPEDHPLSIGAHSDLSVMDDVIASADVVLAVGTRFQLGSNVLRALTIPGTLIHIDIDPGVIDRFHPVDVALVADAGAALAALVAALPEGSADVDPSYVEAAIDARRSAERESVEAMGSDHATVMRTIRELLPRDAIVVKDATVAAYAWANRMLPVYEQRTSMRPVSMAIGPGVPLALGAALGSGRRTLLVQGDGGLMLSVGELATVVQQDAPLVICVFNDRGYGILRFIQDLAHGGRRAAVDLVTPDFAMLARSVGMHATSVSSTDEFEAALTEAVQRDGPALIDVDITVMEPMTIRPQRPAERRR